jgi:hypothetical protein
MAARADEAELKARVAAGEVIPAEQALTTWEEGVSRAKQRLLAIPQKAAPLVAVETETAECFRLIEAMVLEALNELAEANIHSSRGFGGGANGSGKDDGDGDEEAEVGRPFEDTAEEDIAALGTEDDE